jgi:hypothetical protein
MEVNGFMYSESQPTSTYLYQLQPYGYISRITILPGAILA